MVCKSVDILEVQVTLKMPSFFLRELQLITVLLLVRDSYMS